MFSVGVTDNVDHDELAAIASKDDNKHIFKLDIFKDCQHLKRELQSRFSKGSTDFKHFKDIFNVIFH